MKSLKIFLHLISLQFSLFFIILSHRKIILREFSFYRVRAINILNIFEKNSTVFFERHTTALSFGTDEVRNIRRFVDGGAQSRAKTDRQLSVHRGPSWRFCLPFAPRMILARTRRRRSRIPVHMSAYLGPMQTAGIHRPARIYRRTVVPRSHTEAAL